MTDYYTVLGISEDSKTSEINTAYRKQALLFHPDRNNSNDAVAKFNKVAEAFETLSNPNKRKKYDQKRSKKNVGSSATVLRFTSNNANDVFEKIFGRTDIEDILKNASGASGASTPPRASNQEQVQTQTRQTLKPTLKPVLKQERKPKVHTQDETITEIGKPIVCSLEDLYTGKRRIVKLEGYTKMVIVEVPAGCTEDQQLPVKNPENGDVKHFSVHTQKHPVYWRINDNLHMNHELSLEDYVNGFKLLVIMLDGRKKNISYRYGGKTVGPDIAMKIPKLGMPKYNSTDYGHLYIHFKIQLPETLNIKN